MEVVFSAQGHTQRVRIGQTLSSPKNITIGTFQGSCLGPLLYNIFSNDLSCYIPEHMNGFRVTMVRYADDAQLAITGPRSKLAEMQRSLEAVLDVAGTYRVGQRNPEKTYDAISDLYLRN